MISISKGFLTGMRQVEFYKQVRDGKGTTQLAREVGLSQGRVYQIKNKGRACEKRALGMQVVESDALDVAMENAVTDGHIYSFSLDD